MVAPIRVLVVDDAGESRDILRRALAFDEAIEVVGEAASGHEAVSQTEALAPDVVLMDVRMPDGDGVEATEDITRRFPDVKVLALTAYDDQDSVRDMLTAGAIGYLVKGASVDDLVAAIRKAHEGEGQLDERVLPHVIEEMRTLLQQEQHRRAEAERLARARQEFIQVLSHELRTPLTVIGGALQYLTERGLDAQSTELVSAAMNRIGDLERVAGGLELIGEPPADPSARVMPADVIGGVLAMLPRKPDRVEVTPEPWAGVHGHHVDRVTRELLTNAMTHGRPPVEIRLFREGREGVIEVTDAGDLEPDPSLLGPFVQGDMSTTRERGGLGLGLFVAGRLCEATGGRISLERREGRTVAEARFLLSG